LQGGGLPEGSEHHFLRQVFGDGFRTAAEFKLAKHPWGEPLEYRGEGCLRRICKKQPHEFLFQARGGGLHETGAIAVLGCHYSFRFRFSMR
jgi:hypothetical protein